MSQDQINDALAVGSWGAISSSIAAIIALVFQNIIAYLKTKAEIEHQRAQDEFERRRLTERLADLERDLHERDADA